MEKAYDYSKFLRNKENWTPIMIYIHRTRLIAGFTIGISFGLILLLIGFFVGALI